MILIKKTPLTFLIILLFIATVSGQNKALLNLAQAELNKRGLSQSEVELRLSEEGININSIPPAEYPKYQKQILSILDQMQQEKNQNKQVISSTTSNVKTENLDKNNTTSREKVLKIPETTTEEYVAEAEQRELQLGAKKNLISNSIYGHSMFNNKSLDLFRTTDGAEAPETYILGVGDEIRISIFGTSQTDIQQKILEDGSIQPSGLAKIFVKGLSLKQAKKIITKRLANYYDFRSDQLVIRIDGTRTLMVNIFGEVSTQGSFNISALNSAFNALSASGGPTEFGSVREIQWIRSNKKTILDLYKFMKDPSISADLSLENNDILFVPVAQKIVSISGAVKRPMKYEIMGKENLKDLIDFAGGTTVDARPDYVKITRIIEGEEKLFEYDLTKVLESKKTIELKNGDRVNILSIKRPLENFVDIAGEVYYPGRFDLQSNPSLSALLTNAQPSYNAKTDLVFIERIRPNQTIEFLSLPYGDNRDYKLKPRDKVQILNSKTYRDVATISVNGNVRSPFSKSFEFSDKMTISNAIKVAGGLKPTAYNIAYVFRRDLLNPKKTTYIRLNLDQNKDFNLQPGDTLTIYDRTTYTDQMEFSVIGSVRKPFSRTLSFEDKLTVGKAIEIAGGLTPTANKNAYIFRKNWSNPEQTTYIPVDIISDSLVQLRAGDRLNIYDETTFTDFGNVRISGAVRKTQNLGYDPSISLHDLIVNAGGLTTGAAYNNVEVFRVNLSMTQEVQFESIALEVDSDYQLVSPDSFQLQPYDHVVVRMTPEFNLGKTIELNGQVKYPGVYVIDNNNTTLAEVIKIAGGLLDDADKFGSTLFRTYRNRGNISFELSSNLSNRKSIKKNPILFDGDVININRLENTVTIFNNATPMSQYSGEGKVFQNIIYQGNKSAKWYIKNFSGGFLKNADKKSVVVTLPNNQNIGTKRFLGFNIYPKVLPGSTIRLKMDDEKQRKLLEPKEKVDLESTLAKSLTTLTSILSVILLVERL
jgi:protein involved in polysaccharide export with SLBB domain